MRHSLPWTARPLAAASAIALVVTAAALTLATGAGADTNVHGVRGGTQHAPSIAMAEGQIYVLSYDRVDATPTADQLRLAHSGDGGITFLNHPLPTLPAGWYWRPDAQIAYDEPTNQFWMAGEARLVGSPSFQAGVYVATGSRQFDGTIAWQEPLALWTGSTQSLLLPGLALATGDGSGAAFVLFLNPYESNPGTATLYRIQEDLVLTNAIALAGGEPAVDAYTMPALTAAPGGMVFAGWVEIPAAAPLEPAPFVARTSHDSGVTWGPEEFIASLRFVENGPGSVGRTVELPTLLIAKYDPSFPQTRLAFWGSPYSFGPQFDPSEIFLVNDCCGGTWNGFGSTLDRLPGSYELNPAVTQASDGYFYIGWHDFQPYDPDSVSRFTIARLWNMGFSASPSLPFAAATFDWDSVNSNLGGMGWANAAGEFGGSVAFAWADHRGADPDVFARSFRAGSFTLSECAGDTVDVVAGQQATITWRISNHNELFADEYRYGGSGTRSWANGAELQSITLGPDSSAVVAFMVDVPDTAADGLMQWFAYAEDHVRTANCPLFLRIQSLVEVAPDPGANRRDVALAAPRPNPSAGATAFTFSLPAAADVDLAVFDLRGRRVATLARGERGPGEHAARWDGSQAAAGVYFVRLTVRGEAGVMTRERRLVVLR